MRLPLALACVAVITTAPALACPRKLRCLVQRDASAQAEAPRVRLTFEPTRRATVDGEVELPWIWQVLRERVVAKLPSYADDKRFTVVLSPVVVTTPSDTVPGIGVAGDF